MAGDQPDWTGTAASYAQQRSYITTIEENSSIPAGNTEDVLFLAPSGSFVTVGGIELSMQPISGATTGDHEAGFNLNTSGGSSFYVVYGTSNYTDNILYDCGYWEIATKTQQPPSTQPQAWYAGSVGMDDVDGATLYYTNGTDVAATAVRLYALYGIQTVYHP